MNLLIIKFKVFLLSVFLLAGCVGELPSSSSVVNDYITSSYNPFYANKKVDFYVSDMKYINHSCKDLSELRITGYDYRNMSDDHMKEFGLISFLDNNLVDVHRNDFFENEKSMISYAYKLENLDDLDDNDVVLNYFFKGQTLAYYLQSKSSLHQPIYYANLRAINYAYEFNECG